MRTGGDREWCTHGWEVGSGLCPWCEHGDAPPDASTTWLHEELKSARAALSAVEGRLATAEAEREAALDAKHAKLVEVADKLQVERRLLGEARGLIRDLHDRIGGLGPEAAQARAWLTANPSPTTRPAALPDAKERE